MVSTKEKNDNARKKQWRPKVKTGCITCRIRRVKCDETRPNCKRCTSTGRKCDGYPSTFPSAQTYQIAYAPAPRRSPLASAMSGLHLQSSEEQEAFHFYQYRSAAELSGFFDTTFWQCQVLQASHALPAVRHAMVALAAMHRKFIAGWRPVVPDNASDKNLRFALQQSNRAIKEIIMSSARKTIANKINIMTCCILFNCLCCLQGHQATALEHLRSGLRILREIDEEVAARGVDSTMHPISLSTLRALFVNMDIQARGIMNDETLANWEPQPKRDFAKRFTSFKTFSEARYYIESMYNDVVGFCQGLNLRSPKNEEELQKLIQEYRRLRNQFKAGNELLDTFLQKLPRRAEEENKAIAIGIRLIQIQVKVVLKAFGIFERTHEVRDIDFDVAQEDLNILLDLARQLLNADPALTLSSESLPDAYYSSPPGKNSGFITTVPACARPSFSAGSGLLTALWLVTSRARTPDMRRRAIAMMLNYPRREGFWDSVVAGRLAWETMILEETCPDKKSVVGGAGYWPPQSSPYKRENKICEVQIEYTGPRAARIEFRNVKQYLAGVHGVFRDLAW